MEQHQSTPAQIDPDNLQDASAPGHFSLITAYDIELFQAGKHYRMHEKLGAHAVTHAGADGYYFSVWAPAATDVFLIGDFNGWDRHSHPMYPRWDHSGIWELFVPGVDAGLPYKFYIRSSSGYSGEKGDPYARRWELAPATASITARSDYTWTDEPWMQNRTAEATLAGPLSIYELHPGSWKRGPENRLLSYRELAADLPQYCAEMGFSHVEFMPLMEHPFYGSWGYQITGYFAPTTRYGTADDLKFLIVALHRAGIGVILDWVPSHFPSDEHGLGYFDGTHLYEHSDPRQGFHPDWNSLIFNYGRAEVRCFLISNAIYWLEEFHADGLRVDAVASMLYLDYSRKHGEWVPNRNGGRENLEAIDFLRDFNDAVHQHLPGVLTIAEESTAFPGVTRSVGAGGLGFDLKWMMGWMHDTLSYFGNDPVYRRYHQGQLAFSMVYAFSERFVLPFSHDEVVHGKGSMIGRMPGDSWLKHANLRLLYSYMWMHPGAKMIFMGGEFAQSHEWRHDFSLDWQEAASGPGAGLQALVRDLNSFYRAEPALHRANFSPEGFEWIDFQDSTNSVFCWLRRYSGDTEPLIVIGNFTPQVLHNYRIGVPGRGLYTEVFNSDASGYGGSAVANPAEIPSVPIARHRQQHSISLTLPPLALIVLRRSGRTMNWFL